MTDPETKFTATFTLTQIGEDGEAEIYSTVKFDPILDLKDGEDAPAAYELMSHLVQQYLFITGMIDEDGELVDPDAFHSTTKMEVVTGNKLN